MHAVSDKVEGPYSLVPDADGQSPVVIPTFAHNPSVQIVGEKDYVLSHIGCGNGSKTPRAGCQNGTTCNTTWCEPHTAQECDLPSLSASGSSCDTPHWTGMHRASSPRGPWTPVIVEGAQSKCGIEVDGGANAWHKPCITNPSIWPILNGSILMAYSTGCPNCSVSTGHKHVGVAFGEPQGGGSFTFKDLTPLKPIFPFASEDPSIFRDTTNDVETWHVLAHTDFSGLAEDGRWAHVAAHAVAPSPHGKTLRSPMYVVCLDCVDRSDASLSCVCHRALGCGSVSSVRSEHRVVGRHNHFRLHQRAPAANLLWQCEGGRAGHTCAGGAEQWGDAGQCNDAGRAQWVHG